MQFLLERLAHPAPSSPGQFEPFDLRAAIAGQIQRIVSARVVEGADHMSLLEFGMPNIVELSACSKSELERYGARLERLVMRYEPRLRGPRVQVQSTGLPLTPYRLAITGVLAAGGEPETFVFDLPAY